MKPENLEKVENEKSLWRHRVTKLYYTRVKVQQRSVRKCLKTTDIDDARKRRDSWAAKMRKSAPRAAGANDVTLRKVALETLDKPRKKPLKHPENRKCLLNLALAQCPWPGGADVKFSKISTLDIELWLLGGRCADGSLHPGILCLDERRPTSYGKPVAGSTFNHILAIIEEVFIYGEKRGYRLDGDNPMEKADIPREKEGTETARITASMRQFRNVVRYIRGNTLNARNEESADFVEGMGLLVRGDN